jgi:hypothetical protein
MHATCSSRTDHYQEFKYIILELRLIYLNAEDGHHYRNI